LPPLPLPSMVKLNTLVLSDCVSVFANRFAKRRD
jgi:hypothetical protein